MWFDQSMMSKDTITNVQMLQLGAKLYRLQGTNDTDLLAKVNQVWKFILINQLVNRDTFLTAGRADLAGNCGNDGDYLWTYNSGVIAGGLLEMSRILEDNYYLELAHRIANATIVLKSVNGTFTESCDPSHTCDDDAKMFKGIFVRNLRYLMDASNATTRARYALWLKDNMAAVMTNDRCEVTGKTSKCCVIYADGPPFNDKTGPVFSESWRGPFNYSAPMQQTSVLDLFVSIIRPGTICTGPGCSYDPPTPPPHHLVQRQTLSTGQAVLQAQTLIHVLQPGPEVLVWRL
jgi:mannan endo-1,6-alpha-mannosidase